MSSIGARPSGCRRLSPPPQSSRALDSAIQEAAMPIGTGRRRKPCTTSNEERQDQRSRVSSTASWSRFVSFGVVMKSASRRARFQPFSGRSFMPPNE
jgi:hypothetical protein